jgi:pimeloyl-[acyl-carrier protein] synthase
VDPPDHTRLRAIMHSAFSPRRIEGLRPAITQMATDLLDAAGEGEIDVIRDLAYPLPALVIAALLGAPQEDRERFKAWSTDVAADFGMAWSRPAPKAQAQQGVVALLDYMARLVACRRGHPSDDLLQALLRASDEDGRVSEEEVVANAAFLLFAGHETTTNLIGNGLLALLRHPAQLARLRHDPTLIPSAVEELLRYDASVQFTTRVTLEAIELHGRHVAAGSRLKLCLGAANRDPVQFPVPDHLDIARRPNRHLSFSHGIHFCLGAALARLEAGIALAALLDRYPRLDLAAEPAWRDNPDFRGLETLCVRASG